MRVLVLDTYYSGFLDRHYAEHQGLESRPYPEQLASLMARCFGTADAWSTALRALGHEATEIVANCMPLQVRWASEHGAVRSSRIRGAVLPGRYGIAARARLPREIALAQVRAFEADVVLCQDMSFFEREDLDALRRERRLVVGQIASPPPETEKLCGYELILTSFPHFVERFEALGVASRYLRLAYHPAVAKRLHAVGADPDVASPRPRLLTFVGSVDPQVHGDGVEVLEWLASRVPLETFGYGADRLPPGSALRATHRGEAWGLDMYRLLSESRVTINRHIAAAAGHANNMRLYEATGAGALVLTEAAINLGAIFEPDREVATYGSREELLEKLRHYLEHDDERQAVAASGQARTLREHTYQARARELVPLLEERLAR